MKQDMKGKINYGIWGLICGGVILWAYGFGLDGWVTAKTTQKMINDAVTESRTADLASVCVAQFLKDPQSKEKLDELKGIEYTERTGYIEKGGWDKMPGQKETVSGVAQACAYKLEDFMKK
jgi:hypothetical protein